MGCLDDARGVWDAELSLAAAGSYKELQWQIQSDQLRDSPDRAGNNSFAACLIQKKSKEKKYLYILDRFRQNEGKKKHTATGGQM